MANAKAGRNGSDLMFCGCRSCRYGRHAGRARNAQVRAARKAARRAVNAALANARILGDADVPTRINVGYTD